MNRLYRAVGKPILDRLAASILLLLLSPLLLVVAILVRYQHGSPILFRQSRPGLKGKLFRICKFRTMTDQRDAGGNLLPDEQRLTRLGQFLRKSSIDELPALWNVLVGQMSLVGPRPLLPQYRERYTPEQARRQDVRPGITGLAQANGRNQLSWEQKFELDVWYVDHLSVWQDIKIIWQTVRSVLVRDGISHVDHATMPEFMGSTPDIRQVYVIGAGGHAKVVISALRECGHEIAAIFDDNPKLWQQRFAGAPVVGAVDSLKNHPPLPTVIAIGNNTIRKSIAKRLKFPPLTVVHPRAFVDATATLGPGAVVMSGAMVQADATVGAHAIINTSASVDHDCWIGDFAHVGPGCHLAGDVHLGSEGLMGAGAVAIPGARMGSGCTLGAGAVVIYDIPSQTTAVGIPARVLQQRRAA